MSKDSRVYMMIYMSHDVDLMDLRLHELSSVVEKFIVVEYPFDYSRTPCTMYYNENKDRFKEFESQIIHIVDDYDYKNASGLGLFYSRKSSPLLMQSLEDCRDEDFIIICDSDVLITKEALERTDLSKQTAFIMNWFLWMYNCRTDDSRFAWTISAPYNIIKNVTISKMVGYNHPDGVNHIGDSGFHFAKCGGVEKVIENIKGYPHQEYKNNPKLIDPVLVQERIDKPWGWTQTFENKDDWKWFYTPIDLKQYPKYLRENPQIYRKYFDYREGIVDTLGIPGWE